MKLFTLFKPQASPAEDWRPRESALTWGVPMVLLPALAVIPVTASLILQPLFPHARALGFVLLPVLVGCIASGISRLSLCFRRDFDVLSLFAAGTIVALIVISMCAGVIFASVVTGL